MNVTMLINNEIMVIRYFFLFLLIFFRAISPSIPNIFFTIPNVLIFFLFIWISVFCLIASIGDILLAFLAGMYAEIIITKEIGGNNVLFFRGYTDSSGIIDNITLPAPTSGYDDNSFQTSSTTSYRLTAMKDNYDCLKQYIINMIGDVKVLQYIKMIPIADEGETINGN